MEDTPQDPITDGMMELLDLIEVDESSTNPKTDTETLLATFKDRIRSLSALCEQTKIYARSSAKVEALVKELEAEYPPEDRLFGAWNHLLQTILEAPVHMIMAISVRLTLPVVARYLPE